jgi:hypothetical protein
LVFELFVKEVIEQTLLRVEWNYFFFLLAVALDVDVSCFSRFGRPIEDLCPQGFVVFKKEEADDGKDKGDEKKGSLDVAEC